MAPRSTRSKSGKGENGTDKKSLLVPGVNIPDFFKELCKITGIPFTANNLYSPSLAEKILAALRADQQKLKIYRKSVAGFREVYEESQSSDQSPESPASKLNMRCKCNETFKSLSQFYSHIRHNTDKFQYDCKFCQKEFSFKCVLKQHQETSQSCKENANATTATSSTSECNGTGGDAPVVDLPPQNSNLNPPQELEIEEEQQLEDLDISVDVKIEELGDLDMKSQNETDSVQASSPSSQESYEEDIIDLISDDEETSLRNIQLSSKANSPPPPELEREVPPKGLMNGTASQSKRSFVEISSVFNLRPDYGECYGCVVCKETFRNRLKLKRHLEEEHELDPSKQNAVQCGLCGMDFSNSKAFHVHRAQYHAPVIVINEEENSEAPILIKQTSNQNNNVGDHEEEMEIDRIQSSKPLQIDAPPLPQNDKEDCGVRVEKDIQRVKRKITRSRRGRPN